MIDSKHLSLEDSNGSLMRGLQCNELDLLLRGISQERGGERDREKERARYEKGETTLCFDGMNLCEKTLREIYRGGDIFSALSFIYV